MAVIRKHGTVTSYRAGCRCDECRKANSDAKAKERAAKAEREGKVPVTRKANPTAKPTPTKHPTKSRPTESAPSGDDTGTAGRTVPPRSTVEAELAEALNAIADEGKLSPTLRAMALDLAHDFDNPPTPTARIRLVPQLLAVIDRLGGSEGSGGDEHDALLAFLSAPRQGRRNSS